jgi:hypothetical protein
MKKTRWRYDRAFNISVVAEPESGKPLAQIAHKRGSHPPHVNIVLRSVCLTVARWNRLNITGKIEQLRSPSKFDHMAIITLF